MCFSASASFIASGGLIGLGGVSFKVAKKKDKIIAAIPIMFGVQQALEGFQWLYLNNGSSSAFFAYAFLFFAFIVWPIYSPTFIYILDKKNESLKKFIFLGIIVALYSTIILIIQPLSIQKVGRCISYDFHYSLDWLLAMIYLITVFGAFFASNNKILKLFGLLFAILALISWILYKNNFISVWCFFAAVVSSMFFVYIKFKK